MSDDEGSEPPTLAGRIDALAGRIEGLGEHLGPMDTMMKEYFSWYVVAKKEFKDAIRSQGLWALAVVFTALFILPPVLGLYFDIDIANQQQSELLFLGLLRQIYKEVGTIVVPIIAMFVGYGAITKERETGSLKILLSLPHSRRDVVIGKTVGRCAVVGVPLAIAFLVTGLFLTIASVDIFLGVYALFAIYTLGLALVFVAIAVSISGALPKTSWSLIANFVVYIYFTFFWNALANGAADLAKDYLGISGSARWHLVLVLKLFNPTQAYKTIVNSMVIDVTDRIEGVQQITPLEAATQARMDMFTTGGLLGRGRPWDEAEICIQVLNGKASLVRGGFFQPTTVSCSPAGGGLPFYVTDPAVFLYILLWIGLAAFVSYRTFNLADL